MRRFANKWNAFTSQGNSFVPINEGDIMNQRHLITMRPLNSGLILEMRRAKKIRGRH